MTLLKENTSLETKHPVYTISYLENMIQNLESSILNFHSNNVSIFNIQLAYKLRVCERWVFCHLVTKNFNQDYAFCPIFSK